MSTYTVFYTDVSNTSVYISGSLDSGDLPFDVSNIIQVDIGTTVTHIGTDAFKNATNLSSVTFKAVSQLDNIDNSSFRYSGLTSITIPKSVTRIGNQVFSNTSALTTVTFEADSSLNSIGNNAFNLSALLTSIEIPNSVTSIGNNAFASTSSLTTVTFEADSTLATIGTGAFYNSGLTSIEIPKSVTSIRDSAFKTNKLTSVTFEADSSLISIGTEAFRSTSFTSIIIPSSVTSISGNSFLSSGIEDNTIYIEQPSSLAVSYNTPTAFYGATNVTIRRYFPSNLTVFYTATDFSDVDISGPLTSGDLPFDVADITQVAIGNTVTDISNNAFNDATSLTTVTFEADSTLTSIGYKAFGPSALTSITIPKSVTSIGVLAFYQTELSSVTFEADSLLKTIGDQAFGSIPLTSIEIPKSVTSIGDWAFLWSTALTTVTFEANSSLTTIGEGAFQDTSALTSIIIPESVTTIGDNAFKMSSINGGLTTATVNYEKLNDPNYPNFPAGIGANQTIGGKAGVLIIGYNIPSNLTVFYKATDNTSVTISGSLDSGDFPSGYTIKYITRVDIGNTVTSIGDKAFEANYKDTSELTSIFIPKSVTSIGEYAFSYTSALTSVTFEADSSLNSIGDWAFQSSGLTSIDIPKPVTSIGFNAFWNCNNLSSVTFEAESSLTAIGIHAFYLSGLASIIIPKSVTSIGDAAFGGTSLSSIEIPNTVTSIGDSAFYQTSDLSSVTFEANSSLKTIGDNAFQNTSSLTSIVIPSSVTNISSNAFSSSGISGETIYIEQPSSLAVSYNTPTTFFGANNVTIVRALSPPSGNGWYLFGSSGLPWSSSKISWGLNGYNIYQYIYDLSGSTWISDNWTAIDISGNDPVLPEYSAYWVKVIT